MKVAIVGAAGRVGSNTAFALQLRQDVRELALIDLYMAEAAEGEALDLRHGACLAGRQVIYSGDYTSAKDADLIIITAGVRRRPEESRLDLINRNITVFRSVLEELKKVGFKEETILCIVSNPVDILTYIATLESGLPPQQVIGTGTFFDTVRFRSLIAEYYQVDPRTVQAMILGEHGDSMVPIWSRATVNGVPLSQMPGYSLEKMHQIFEDTRKAGAEVIRLKGGAGWGIALTTAEFVSVVARDSHTLLPLSTLQEGIYGLEKVAISVPTVLGREGVIAKVELPLAEEELKGLQHSAEVLRTTLDQVGL